MTRTALVTGASGGIGSATAAELGRDHDVLVHYHRRRERAASVADRVEAEGNRAAVHGCDVADPTEVGEMVDYARDELGGIDVLVNNAAVFDTTGIEEREPEGVRRMLAVNLEGPIHCTRAVLPGMRERGRGWIVNVSSTAGTRGSRVNPVYGASKGGLNGLTRSLARLYTAESIFANAIAPGPTAEGAFPDEFRAAAIEGLPLGRLIEPDEIAAAVRFLATTTSVAGEVLEVDAGANP